MEKEINRIFESMKQMITVECMLNPPKENAIELITAVCMFSGWFISMLDTEGDKENLRTIIIEGIIDNVNYFNSTLNQK